MVKQISKDAAITIVELANNISTTKKTIRYHIEKLKNEGIVVK